MIVLIQCLRTLFSQFTCTHFHKGRFFLNLYSEGGFSSASNCSSRFIIYYSKKLNISDTKFQILSSCARFCDHNFSQRWKSAWSIVEGCEETRFRLSTSLSNGVGIVGMVDNLEDNQNLYFESNLHHSSPIENAVMNMNMNKY